MEAKHRTGHKLLISALHALDFRTAKKYGAVLSSVLTVTCNFRMSKHLLEVSYTINDALMMHGFTSPNISTPNTRFLRV